MLIAVYDIVGIQSFIFSSNKMKENVGASLLVEIALSEWLPEVIKETFNKAKLDWEKNEDFIPPDTETKAVVVYIGGGNAIVCYNTPDSYVKVNSAFSKKLLYETANELGYATSYVDCSQDLCKDVNELFCKLLTEKSRHNHSKPMLGIGITREGVSDGLPSVYKRDNNYLSLPSIKKIDASEVRKKRMSELLNNYSFPQLLDDLGMKEGDNFIAVVHIDGNDMGKLLKETTKSSMKYNTGLSKLRNLSLSISETYRNVFIKMLNVLNSNQADIEFRDQFSVPKQGLMIRPLVLNGDDITFVVDGRLGIPLAIEFLKRLKKQTDNTSQPLSACAGIAIVKSHFPFYRAYQLAEELCANAKRKAKLIEGDKKGCWIDWHISQTGIVNNLSSLRDKHYNVRGMSKATIDIAKTQFKYKPHNLLWRPWRIDGADDYSFKRVLEPIIEEMKKKLPRSRIKNLRNYAVQGKLHVDSYLEEMKSRGLLLPKYNGKSDSFFTSNNMTPYFDAIETMEMFYGLKEVNKKEVPDE